MNNFSPSRRHWRHLGSRFLATIYSLNTAFLRRTAAVMWNWRHIRNTGDFKTRCVQCTHCGFTPRTGTFDTHLQILYTAFLRNLAGLLSRNLGSKGSALSRSLETGASGGRPRQGITLTVCDGHDRVIE